MALAEPAEEGIEVLVQAQPAAAETLCRLRLRGRTSSLHTSLPPPKPSGARLFRRVSGRDCQV